MTRLSRIYFIAGEASGDAHGAALMNALRALAPSLLFAGRGGPRMQTVAGSGFLDWSAGSAVLGLWEVLKQYGYFRKEFAATILDIREQQPDAVVLIDYPGFNLRLARALRRQLPTLKIIYYISPQVWAWNRRRIPQMAKYLDLMLCIFPFEADLYNQSGLRTVFVGHPMMESLEARRILEPRDRKLIGLFPGSRGREVRKILPVLLEAARLILIERPESKFEIAAASETLAQEIQPILQASGLAAEAVRVTIGEASATMQRAHVGLVASGTATLEAAYFRLPFILVYKVALLTYIAAKIVVRLKHVGMPNVLAGREIVPEFIQHEAEPAIVAGALVTLILSEKAREDMIAHFDDVIAQLGEGGANAKAAEAIFQELAGTPAA